MTIIKLLETSIIADLVLDSIIAPYAPKRREQAGRVGGDDPGPGEAPPAEDPNPVTISVSAEDQGEFYAGSGIKKMQVTVEARANLKADGITEAIFDTLCEKIEDRLPTQVRTPAFQERQAGLAPLDQRLSNSSMKVYGCISGAVGRGERGFIRVRKIVRTIIAAQLV
jgi:hypothetical protein